MEHSRSIIYIVSFLTFKRTICWSFDEVETKHPVYRYVLFNRKRWNIWRNTNDTKKCMRQKLYGIAGNILFRIALFCIVYLVTTLKRPARVTSEFLFFIPPFLITYSWNWQSNVFKTLQTRVFRTIRWTARETVCLRWYHTTFFRHLNVSSGKGHILYINCAIIFTVRLYDN